MKKLKGYIDKLKAATPEKQREAMRALLNKSRTKIVALVKNQLMHGVDGEGRQLRQYRSKAYAAFKKTLNPLGVTDLKLTGKFHRGIYVDTSVTPVKIDSSDSKTAVLKKEYGKSILDLNKDSQEVLIKQQFSPDVLKWYRKLYKL